MIQGHVYQKLTSARSPTYKRQCFDSAFKQLCHTDFEGGRPSRETLREMAWERARRDAFEERALHHAAI